MCLLDCATNAFVKGKEVKMVTYAAILFSRRSFPRFEGCWAAHAEVFKHGDTSISLFLDFLLHEGVSSYKPALPRHSGIHDDG